MDENDDPVLGAFLVLFLLPLIMIAVLIFVGLFMG